MLEIGQKLILGTSLQQRLLERSHHEFRENNGLDHDKLLEMTRDDLLISMPGQHHRQVFQLRRFQDLDEGKRLALV